MKSTQYRLSTCFLILALGVCQLTLAFPGGAPPNDACEDMTPHHNVADQEAPAPFEYIVDNSTLAGGEGTKITIKTRPDGPTFFRGLLVMGRKWETEDKNPYGTIISSSINPSTSAKTIACKGIENSAITHSNNENKTSVTFDWVAPCELGEFDIVVTLVQERVICWSHDNRLKVRVTDIEKCSSTSQAIRVFNTQNTLLCSLLLIAIVIKIFA